MNKLAIFFLVLALAVLFLGSSGNPPNGYTGAPGESMCSNCHTQGGSGNINGSLEILGLPTNIVAGQTYTITLRINNSSSPLNLAVRGGFQLVALDQSNTNIGTFSSPSTSSTLTNSGGKVYWEHNPFKNFSGGNNVSWTVNWQAPAVAQGQVVTLYSAAILANGNGSNSGDLMVSTQATGSLPGPPPLTASISNIKNVSCFDGNDGSISATASNGIPPYSYDWSNGQSGPTASGLNAGSYSVTVSDQSGSSVILNRAVTQPALIQINGNGRFALNCNGDANGFINLTVSGGVPPYSYSWSGGQRTRDIANLKTGEYTVTVKDNNQCEQLMQFFIDEPDSIKASIRIEQYPDCIKSPNGILEILGSGGLSPYTYKWNSGEQVARITGKEAGKYDCLITDKNSCSRSISILLPVLDTIRPKILAMPRIDIFLNQNGKAYIPDSMFLKNIQDNCDTGLVVNPALDSIDCNRIGDTVLLVYAKDLAGNTDSGWIQIRILDSIPPVVSGWKDSVTSRCDLVVPELSINDNCGIREIRQLSGPGKGTFFPLGESLMRYEIEDLAGNILPYEYKVTVISPLTLGVDTILLDRCTGEDPILVLRMGHMLDSNYSLFINDSLLHTYDTATIDTIIGVKTSVVSIILKDSFLCSKRLDLSIQFNEPLTKLDSFFIRDASSCNSSDGEINLSISGKFFKGIWLDSNNNPLQNQSGTNLPPGTYFFKVFSHEESDPEVCIFQYGPFEISCLSADYRPETTTAAQFEFYPNPSYQGKIEFQLSDLQEGNIKIMDIQGQLVFGPIRLTAGRSQMNLDQLAPGFYWIRFESGDNVLTRKWINQR